MPHMIEDCKIMNKLGLHARAAAQFVKVASHFQANIKVSKHGIEVNGKSIIGLLTLAAGLGSTVRLDIDGEDAVLALKTLKELVAQGFATEP